LALTNLCWVIEPFINLKFSPSARDILPCRNDLDIFDRKYRIGFDSKSNPKLLMIMMNPGGAEISDGYQHYTYTRNELLGKVSYLQKVPVNFDKDKTLFQVIRLMYHYNIPHTQVINISDYQNT
jgi:hypothetical protein